MKIPGIKRVRIWNAKTSPTPKQIKEHKELKQRGDEYIAWMQEEDRKFLARKLGRA
jgi:hypothetical protein